MDLSWQNNLVGLKSINTILWRMVVCAIYDWTKNIIENPHDNFYIWKAYIVFILLQFNLFRWSNRISNWVEWTEIVALSWMLKLGWLRRKIREIRFSMIIIIVTVPGFRTTSENENIYIKSSPLKLLRYDIEFHCRLMFDCDFGCDSTSQRSVVATA